MNDFSFSILVQDHLLWARVCVSDLSFKADDGDGAVEFGFLEGFAVFFEALADLVGVVFFDHLMELGEAFFVHLPIVGRDFGAEGAADAFESLVFDGDHGRGRVKGEM